MKLIEKYALESGLKIGSQFLLDSFYPLSVEKYVTLQASSGMAAKNYPYYQEVLVLLLPIFAKHNISIVQLGSKDDPPIQGCIHLHGKTSLHQANYILERSILHFGNDSWFAHRAGELGIALITLFGSTRASNHGAYRFNPEKTRFLESHRSGKNPTFAAQEQPQTISFIPPEQIVNAVLDLLELPDARLTQQSRLFGLLYTHALFEVIPNSFPGPDSLPGIPMTVRMDYLFDENVLANFLMTGRKINIITNKEININLLVQFRQSIIGYTHELNTSCQLEYVAAVRGLIQHNQFLTKEKDEKKVAELRFHFFDICFVEKVTDVTKEDYLDTALAYLNWGPEKRLDLEREITDNKLKFKSNKYILSEGKSFLSLAHQKRGLSVDNLQNNSADLIDDPDYWKDINHNTIYYQP